MGLELVTFKRKRRVRMHLIDRPGIDLPRIDGLLISRRHNEYLVGVPELLLSAEGNPVTPEGRYVVVPRDNVAFYELI